MIHIKEIVAFASNGDVERDGKLESMIEDYVSQQHNKTFSDGKSVSLILFKSHIERIKGSLLFSADDLMRLSEKVKTMGIQGYSKSLIHLAVETHEIYSIIEQQLERTNEQANDYRPDA